MIGNPTACIDGCAPPDNQKKSPNGDAGVDAMLSVFAHELTEAVSDPISDIDAQRAWQDASGAEVRPMIKISIFESNLTHFISHRTAINAPGLLERLHLKTGTLTTLNLVAAST